MFYFGFLFELAAGFVARDEIPSAQLAVARHGKLVATRAWGRARSRDTLRDADEKTLYVAFSATKAVLASAAWLLLQDGALDLREPVAAVIPGFAEGGKGAVLVEHLLTHTAGFPEAPFDPLEWDTPARRLARFASWRLDWEPGSRFAYHATSATWALAEVIERRSGHDFRTFIRERITAPLGLADLHVGLPAELSARVADVVHVGTAPTGEELAALGLELPLAGGAYEAYLSRYNLPEIRAVGAPGSGACTTAAALALFYQALLGGGRSQRGEPIWRPETLARALEVRTGELVDPITGRLASRALGVIVAGDDQRVFRGFAPGNSSHAFGHPGVGGQIAWADPATGVSFVFLTNGLERHPLRMGLRGLSLSSAVAGA